MDALSKVSSHGIVNGTREDLSDLTPIERVAGVALHLATLPESKPQVLSEIQCETPPPKRRRKRTERIHTPKGGCHIFGLSEKGERTHSLYLSPRSLTLMGDDKAIVYSVRVVGSPSSHTAWSPGHPQPEGDKKPWRYSGSTFRGQERAVEHVREQQQGTHPKLHNVWNKYKDMRLKVEHDLPPTTSPKSLVALEKEENERSKEGGYRSANSGPFIPMRRKRNCEPEQAAESISDDDMEGALALLSICRVLFPD